MKFSEEILKELNLEQSQEKEPVNVLRVDEIKQTENEKIFFNELLLRNEITHDYFNRELHLQKLIWIMENCSDGAIDVYHDIEKYCTEKNLDLLYVDKNTL